MFGKFIMCFPLRLTTTITVVVATTTITNTTLWKACTTIVKSESVPEQKHQQHARILGEKQRTLYTMPCKNTHKCRCYSSQIRDILCVRARFSTHTYTTNSSQCLKYFEFRSLYVSMRSFACYFFSSSSISVRFLLSTFLNWDFGNIENSYQMEKASNNIRKS